MAFTLGKKGKLKSKKAIEILFKKGHRVKCYPLQLVYLKNLEQREELLKAGFSVPKRTFKKAVTRNEIKRLMREVFRKQKSTFSEKLNTPYDFMIVYIGKEKLPYQTLGIAMDKLCQKFLTKTAENET